MLGGRAKSVCEGKPQCLYTLITCAKSIRPLVFVVLQYFVIDHVWLSMHRLISIPSARSYPNLSRPPFNAHIDVLLPYAERINYRPVLLRIHQLHLLIPCISENLDKRKHSQSGRLTSNVLIKLGTNLYISLALIFFPRHR